MQYTEDLSDEVTFPPTVKAADGRTTLTRFRVEAIIYAPTIEQARYRLAQDIYLDAGVVKS